MPCNGNNASANNRPLSKEALAAIPVLRSLIISEKGTSTLKRILNDYCKEEGEPLPFRKFGFPSAVEYLKATDEFVLRTHLGETTIFVKPKADTAHIQKMVAAQKPAKVQQKPNVYHWRNPQLRFSNQTGYMPKSLMVKKNPNNPLKRFFPTNSTAYYPKISSSGNENVPPKPSVPPKPVPSLATPTVPYAKVVSAVKVEPRETKPIVMKENVPPLPVTSTQQAYVRPMPSNNYSVKGESPFVGLPPIHTAPKNPCAVQNQNNQFLPNPSQNDRIVQQAKNTYSVPNQQNQISPNQFYGNMQCPPGFYHRQPQPTAPVKQFTPINYNIPPPTQYRSQNMQYTSYPNYQPIPQYPQHQQQFPNNNNATGSPFALLQQQLLQQQTPSPQPPQPLFSSVASDNIINILDQQVQMLHESVKSLKSSYQQSRVQLQTKLNQEVEMMEAIVRQYQRSVTDQQKSHQAAVDRLNQQLEMLHASCRASH